MVAQEPRIINLEESGTKIINPSGVTLEITYWIRVREYPESRVPQELKPNIYKEILELARETVEELITNEETVYTENLRSLEITVEGDPRLVYYSILEAVENNIKTHLDILRARIAGRVYRAVQNKLGGYGTHGYVPTELTLERSISEDLDHREAPWHYTIALKTSKIAVVYVIGAVELSITLTCRARLVYKVQEIRQVEDKITLKLRHL